MPIPVICLLIMFALIHLPKSLVAREMKALDGRYDNQNPRAQQARLEGLGQRALAAHNNGFEGFPLFAAGAILAVTLDADPTLAAALSLSAVGARVVYILLYIKGVALMRSLVWTGGMLCAAGLVVSPWL